MTLKPEVLDAMVATGCTAEQIAAAVKASIPSRTSNAERQARYRERQRNARNATERNSNARNVTPPTPSPIKEKDQKKINPTPAPVCVSHTREAVDLDAEFVEFWSLYPHKVGKPDAQRKFVAARKSASQSEITAGLHRYIASKPEDRAWCNPSTWLHQERWADQPAPVASGLRVVGGQQGPPRKSGAQLMVETGEEMLREMRGEPEADFWNQGRMIDGHAHRR